MSEKIEMVIEDIKDFVDNLDQPSLPSSTSSNIKIKTFSFNFKQMPKSMVHRNVYIIYMLENELEKSLLDMRDWWKENSDKVLHIKANGNYALLDSTTSNEFMSAKNIMTDEVNAYLFNNLENDFIPYTVENCLLVDIKVNSCYVQSMLGSTDLERDELIDFIEGQNFRFFTGPKSFFTKNPEDLEQGAFFQVSFIPWLGVYDKNEEEPSTIDFNKIVKCNIDVSFIYVEE